MPPNVQDDPAESPRGFSTTCWQLLAGAGGENPKDGKADARLDYLCRTYWRPIFLYVSRRYASEDAEDLTQDFFAMILNTNWLDQADRRRGRFRSIILKTLENFLNDDVDRRRTSKRGGKVEFISWDEWRAEAPSQLAVSPEKLASMPDGRLFDLRWAATVVEQALRRLSEEFALKKRRRLFDCLSPYLDAEREISYVKLGSRLRAPEATVKRQLYHMRQRYRWLLREEVGRTLTDSVDVDDEIRYLCAALGGGDGTIFDGFTPKLDAPAGTIEPAGEGPAPRDSDAG